MAFRALFFGVDDTFKELSPFYAAAIQRGDIEVVGYASIEPDGVKLYSGGGGDPRAFEIAIISSYENYYERMKVLESAGVSRSRIINGRVFRVPNVDIGRVVREGVAYGVIGQNVNFNASGTFVPYPQVYSFVHSPSKIILDRYTYLVTASLIDTGLTGGGTVNIGGFCSVAANTEFALLPTSGHNYRSVWTYHSKLVGWGNPPEISAWEKAAETDVQIRVGSDVWIGHGSFLKAARPDKPLIIGHGAVIASKSVVVKNVPPYAIVGGNPAQIIKYRFPEKIIEGLLRIKWWEWDVDKLHDNSKYFNRVEEFVEMHDK